ncbi:MAG TPA: penicillin-binding protein 2 [Luteolibacter sp.]|nr:penicillin-binding protein 2 [Luteolibacter sp.]
MNNAFQTRCIVLCTILVIVLSVLSGRLVQIQLVDRHRYAESSRKAYHRIEKLPAIRGMIVDRHEEPLARSIPVSTVFVDKNHLYDYKLAAFGLAYEEASAEEGWYQLDEAARSRRIHALRGDILNRETGETIVAKHLAYAIGVLARPLGMRREELRDRIENSRGKWVPVAKDLPEDVADGLREMVDKHWLQGFEFQNSIKRWYTAPNLATHLIGFTGEIEETNDEGKIEHRVVGRFGIESAMEDYLAGRDGWRQHSRDARGLVVPGGSTSLLPPRAGLNVQLTLDMGLQAIVEEELDACLDEFVSKRGAVVLMDPKTGEVLALASRPHFDLNQRREVAANGFNYAVQAIYEPGSTFKIVAAAAVLNERLAGPQSTVFCHHGLYREGAIRVPDHHPYGNLTLEGVLVKSSNIGIYKFARQLGVNRFYDYSHRWGFGSKTGIMLSGESAGICRNTGNAVDFSRASYGYALNVTPLQMACAYSVIAGDGRLLKPRIVKSLVANDGTVIENYPPEVVAQVIKPAVAKQMREALAKVTEEGGTGTLAAVPGYKVPGKTGTAKKHNPLGRGYYDDRYTVSFAGMLPAQDPAFVGIVVIDDPLTNKVKRYGGTIAAPAFGRIGARAAAYLNLKPTEPIPADLADRTQ